MILHPLGHKLKYEGKGELLIGNSLQKTKLVRLWLILDNPKDSNLLLFFRFVQVSVGLYSSLLYDFEEYHLVNRGPKIYQP